MGDGPDDGAVRADGGSAAPGERTAALLARVERVAAALAAGGAAIPETTAQTVAARLDGVRERLRLGVDHTVVALAGGTGSGKSSLFNAVSRLSFADVGVRRPTTSQVTACVWAHDATALLDWLGVAAERRIERESLLDGDSEADLRGLVLLDLPDHDSVEPAHRAVVDRIVPLADLVVWVVDPQKYADDALHSRYLQQLVGHEASMLVVLNQVDTVPEGARDTVVADVGRLLRADGLTDVPVLAVSARTGEGVPGLREVLAASVAARGVAERRVAAELDDLERVLVGTAGLAEPSPLPVEDAVDGLAAAAGVPGAVDEVRAWTRGGTGPVVTWGRPQTERVEQARERWVARCVTGLPRGWADVLDAAVPPPDAIATKVGAAVEDVGLPPLRTRARTVARVVALALGAVALVLLGSTAGALVGADGWTATATLLALVTGGVLLVAAAAAGVARALSRRAARRRAEAFDAALRERVGAVVAECLTAPTARVHDAHRAVRTLAA